jgi:hypothetical protein
MDVTFATEPGDSGENLDFVGATCEGTAVLDGLTVPAGVRTGCVHGTGWYVRQLGGRLLSGLGGRDGPSLVEDLADAITAVARLHAGTCDLANPATPSATVAVARDRGDTVDVLVLADAAVVVGGVDGARVVVDQRVAKVAGAETRRVEEAEVGTPSHRSATAALVEAQLGSRNQPGGYWIAGALPHAADEALVETIPARMLRRAALLSDGASRFTDVFHLGTWDNLLDTLETQGPRALITRVRTAELDDPAGRRYPRLKTSDDATAAFCSGFTLRRE